MAAFVFNKMNLCSYMYIYLSYLFYVIIGFNVSDIKCHFDPMFKGVVANRFMLIKL
jgi:hypothetical protein